MRQRHRGKVTISYVARDLRDMWRGELRNVWRGGLRNMWRGGLRNTLRGERSQQWAHAMDVFAQVIVSVGICD